MPSALTDRRSDDMILEIRERLLRVELGSEAQAKKLIEMQVEQRDKLDEMQDEQRQFIAESRADRHERRNQTLITDQRLATLEQGLFGDPKLNKVGLEKKVDDVVAVITSSKAVWKFIGIMFSGTLAVAGVIAAFWQYLSTKH